MSLSNKLGLNIKKEDRLATYEGPDRVISSKEYKKRLKEEKIRVSFKSLLPALDRYTEGFELGELIIISGYTGHGKTSLCQTFTLNLATQKVNSLWFSFEMTGRQFFAKFPKVPLFYLPLELKGKALEWIEDRIVEGKIKYNTRVIFIDHLHFVVDIATRHPSLEIGKVVRALKTMAIKHNIVIFLVAHTSMPRGDSAPTLGDIRDSSFITQESDAAFIIQRLRVPRTKFYGNESRITILKHRRMGTIGKGIKVFYVDKQFIEKSYAGNEP